MTAAGKVTAATIFTSVTHPQGQGPVRVLLVKEDAAKLAELGITREALLQVATKKTGGETLAVVEAETRMTSGGFHRASRQYRFRTSQGWTTWMAAAQTMWLAPEDPAGVKRAHAEALKEDQDRDHAEKVRAQLRTADTDRLMDALTDAPPSLAALIQEELAGRLEAAQAGVAEALDALAPTLEAERQAEKEALELAEKAAPELAARLATGSVAEVLDRGPVLTYAMAAPTIYPDRKDFPVELAPGVAVAPMGTPEPSPEDLADLALALAAEMAEHPDPEEEVTPAAPKCQPRDVVTIHRGDRLYEVLRVEKDGGWDRIRREAVDHSMALVAPLDPEDHRDPQWVHLDLLHVRRPVAYLATLEVTERVRQAPQLLRLGERLVQVRTIQVDSRRLPAATLAYVPRIGHERAAATLRVGEAIVVDGRCYAVELGGRDQPALVPAPHRDRLHVPGPREPEARAEAIRDWEESNRPY